MTLSRDEFSRLALEQLDAVDRVARSLARSAAEADDLVQETYLNALKGADTYHLREHGIRPWLLRILHNLHLNRVKRERRQPAAMEREHLEALPGVDEGGGDPVETLDFGSFADEALDAALGQLPPDLRTILVLWAVDELSYKELAEVLEVPIGTVMSRLHRARRRLIALLPDHPAARRARE